MNRRDLLKGCSDFMKSMTQNEDSNFSFSDNDSDEILIVIFLRGGYDGLNFLAPVNDKDYIAARGENLRITDSGKNEGLAIKQNFLDADFRLYKSTEIIKEIYDDKQLAFVHASGLTNGTRSHFVAQELIEKGTLKDKALRSGWLARYLEEQDFKNLSAYSIGNNQAESLLSANKVLSLNKIEDLNKSWNDNISNMMRNSYSGNSLIKRQGLYAMDIQEYLDKSAKKVNLHKVENLKKKTKSKKSSSKLQNDLNTLEAIIKMDVGLKIGTINMGGWDTHDGQEGRYSNNMQELSKAVGNFYNNLHQYHKKLNIVVMSEFGRRVKANKNEGTDHGYGNVMWVIGGNVKGGNIYGKWPGLANDQLNKGVDLDITTDYRTVLSEILSKRMKQKDISTIFPKFSYKTPLGIIS